ncbi:MAG: hypothetical protein MI892_14670 [Desulfobacterales bacterium]|nr:hypothetical protein [Desulfobacterales bacterium]
MRIICLWIMAFCYCLFFSSAWGSELNKNNILDKRITIYGGARFYQAEGTFSSTRNGNSTAEVDMDDLGLDKNEVSAIGGVIYNFGKRWNLRFDYFGYHDDALKTADKSFNFDDVNIPINASLESSLDIDLYVINLAYNIIHTQKARFGLGLGVHGIDFELKIAGKVSVGPSEVSLGEGQEDFLAPIPNVWAYGAYALSERVVFRYGGGWMSASYDDFDGSLFLLNAAIEYWPFQNIGFGAGYNYLTADIDYDPGYKKENYDVDLSGAIFYITLGF